MWRACVTTSQGYADQRPGALPGNDADELLWEAIAEPSRRRVLDLTRAGLVEGHKQGREVRYSVIADRLDAASQAMAHVAAQWDVRLQAIKRLAEAQAAVARPESQDRR